jgi:hypothetical protein
MAQVKQKYWLGLGLGRPNWIGLLSTYLLILFFTTANAYALEEVEVTVSSVDGRIGDKPPPNVSILDTPFKVINQSAETRIIEIENSSNCNGLEINNIVIVGIKSTDDRLIGRIMEINRERLCRLTLGEASLAEVIQDGQLDLEAHMVITSSDAPRKIGLHEGSEGSFLKKVATEGAQTSPRIHFDLSSWTYNYQKSILFPSSKPSSTTTSVEVRIAIKVDYKLSLIYKGGILQDVEASATSCQTADLDFDAKSKFKFDRIRIWNKETPPRVFTIGWLPVIVKGIGSLYAEASSSADVKAKLLQSKSAVDVGACGPPGKLLVRRPKVEGPEVNGPQIKDAKIEIEGSLIPELTVEFYGAVGTTLRAKTTARVAASAGNRFTYSLNLVAGVEPVLGKSKFGPWTLWSYEYPKQ